jgi:hypothetical protein
MGPSLYSRYCIVVDNLSGSTRTDDVEYEASYFGKIRDLARDHRARCAIIEFDRCGQACVACVCGPAVEKGTHNNGCLLARVAGSLAPRSRREARHQDHR